MKILAKLGPTGHLDINVEVPTSQCSVADALAAIRAELPPYLLKQVRWSERCGASVFLAAETKNFFIRLSSHSLLTEYDRNEAVVVWFMWSHVNPQSQELEWLS